MKAKARANPEGIVLTTPESVEAMLVRRGPEIARLFRSLKYVVIDEMHAFMGQSRGTQLQSLLHRLDVAIGTTPIRVGLSATLADMAVAARFLRPRDPDRVEVLAAGPAGQDIRLQIRGYIKPIMARGTKGGRSGSDIALGHIADHLFLTMRGKRGLIFANSRSTVEALTADMKSLCEREGIPDEFHAHHGSLSRDHREDAERRLKNEANAGSIIATTTLEMGIDIGHIETVSQIGPGGTVSGLRQRLGRSGRRHGQVSTMRVYISETEIDEGTHPIDRLRLSLVQSIAMINLMLQRWNEPSARERVDVSTLLHQIMAIIAQKGGARADRIWGIISGGGAFPSVSADLFTRVLRQMGARGLIEQSPDGLLLPGATGEKIIQDRGFFAVFKSTIEFRVSTKTGKVIGTVPSENPIVEDQLLILAGRRWRVDSVDLQKRDIIVEPSSGGRPPVFGGEGVSPAAGVVAEMRQVLEGKDKLPFTDPQASLLLDEGRANYFHNGLHETCRLQNGDDIILFPWLGGPEQLGLRLALASRGLVCSPNGIAVNLGTRHKDRILSALKEIAEEPPPSARGLALLVPELQVGKFDEFFDRDILAESYAPEFIDTARLPEIAAGLIKRWD